MDDLIIDTYRDLIEAYLAVNSDANEDAIEEFEIANDGVVDAFYKREVVKLWDLA